MGADAFFFSGLPLQEQAKAYDALKKPLMMGATPTLTGAEAKANKVSLLFCHVENVGIGAIHQALKELKTTDKYETAAKVMLSAEVNQKLVAQPDWTARAQIQHHQNLVQLPDITLRRLTCAAVPLYSGEGPPNDSRRRHLSGRVVQRR